MLTALTILLWLVGGVIALALLLICIPVHLLMAARSEPSPVFSLEVRLLSGRAPRLLLLDSRRMAAGRKSATEKLSRSKTRKKKRIKRRKWLSRRRLPDLIQAVPALIADTVSGVHLDRLHIRAEFGLGDPAETGRIFGLLAPLTFMPLDPRISVAVNPNFAAVCLKGRADAALHFVPIRMAIPAMWFARKGLMGRS